jgi:hypothetical protein
MSNKKVWSQPSVRSHGSAANITRQVVINKVSGSGDTVNLIVPGVGTIPIVDPQGGSIISCTPACP